MSCLGSLRAGDELWTLGTVEWRYIDREGRDGVAKEI